MPTNQFAIGALVLAVIAFVIAPSRSLGLAMVIAFLLVLAT